MKDNYSIILTLTPKRNVLGGEILDPSKVKTKRYGENTIIKVFDWGTLLPEMVAVKNIDIDHQYVSHGMKDYKVIKMERVANNPIRRSVDKVMKKYKEYSSTWGAYLEGINGKEWL